MIDLGKVDPRTLIGRSVGDSRSDQQKTFPMCDRQGHF
jgi:hypothetical protein